MAKALYGHLTAPDLRLLAEVVRLRERVARLEAENAALRDGLLTLPDDERFTTTLNLPEPEPALA